MNISQNNDLKFTTAGDYMNDRIVLSHYFADNDSRESLIEHDRQAERYYVRVKSAFGSWSVACFTDSDSAEIYAEDWVS